MSRVFAFLASSFKSHFAALDAIALFGAAALVFAGMIALHLVENFHHALTPHDHYWGPHDFLFAAGFLSLATLIFAARRVYELRAEIARREEAEAAARRMALHDPLTGLPNRRHFAETLERTLAYPIPPGHCHAVLLLDLNDFKHVNDVFGHPAGDELLIRIGEMLQTRFEGECCMARLGGDEFAILGPYLSNAGAAARLSRRIVKTFDDSIEAAGHHHLIGVSIGIALSPQDGMTAIDLMRRADIALYRAKATGGSASCFFERQMDDHVRNRVAMEHELRQAIESGDIVPFYQPVVDLTTGRILGFEALARWLHPVKGTISPDRFIPVAEDSALIRELTETILRRACRDALAWPPEMILSVNLSSKLLKDRAVGLRILAILTETGLPPQRLEVEVTESALVNDLVLAQSVLGGLKEAGVRIALDDFGTGYSSICHLRSFRFDKIKIDRSYVNALGHDSENDAILRAVLGLGHSLGLTVTAEGIEKAGQRDTLIGAHCQEGQGYLFGKPLPAEETTRLLSQNDFTGSTPNAKTA